MDIASCITIRWNKGFLMVVKDEDIDGFILFKVALMAVCNAR